MNKVISMIQNIKVKLGIINDLIQIEVEQSMSNIKAMVEMISEYESKKNTFSRNIYRHVDKKASLLAANSSDREFFERLHGIEITLFTSLILPSDSLIIP